MSRCDPRALEALLFDELPTEAAAERRRHLSACDGCTRAWSELRELRSDFLARRVAPPPLAPMFQAIERRLGERARLRPRAWEAPLVVSLATACLAVILALVTVPHGRQIHPPHHSVPPAWFSGTERDFDAVASTEAEFGACLIATPEHGVPNLCQ
jgi:anti-sigma factor RsiW